MPDVFISHASRDKTQIARPLAEELRRRGFSVWYDEFSLALGDSLRRKIDKGLADSRFGIVILSRNFFAQEWTQRELDGLTSREVSGSKVILPIWHGVTREEVAKYSPVLADRLGISSDRGIDRIADEVEQVVGANLLEEVKEAGIESHAESRHGRFALPEKNPDANRNIWRAVWAQTAPLPVAAFIQWVLAVFILHGINPLLGLQMGQWSPLWLLPLSFITGWLIPRRPIAAYLTGAAVGGAFGGTISYFIFDWSSSYGAIFGGFLGGFLASYWSDPGRHIRALMALVHTILFVAALGVFGNLAYYRDLGGLAYFGTAASIVILALVAILLKIAGVLAKIAPSIPQGETRRERDHDPWG